MAEMIQQALANAGIGNRSTMAGQNGTVVQAPTEQAPTEQAPTRNDTNPYLPHGQNEVATLLLSDLLHGEEEEEEGNTGNTGNNEESFSPVFTPHRGQSHRGQLVVDTQAATSKSSSPVKLQVFSQQSNPVSDGEEGS